MADSVRVSQASPFVATTPQATPLAPPTPMAAEMLKEEVREDRSIIFGISIPQFTIVELRQLKIVHVEVPEVPIFHSIPKFSANHVDVNPVGFSWFRWVHSKQQLYSISPSIWTYGPGHNSTIYTKSKEHDRILQCNCDLISGKVECVTTRNVVIYDKNFMTF